MEDLINHLLTLESIGQQILNEKSSNLKMNLSRANESTICVTNCSSNFTTIDVSHLCVTLQRSFDKNVHGSFASSILITVINSFFAIFAVVVNLLIMIALNKKEELKTAANLILNSMALSDFLVGLTVQPLSVVYHILDIYHLESCKVKLVNSHLGTFCVGASMFSAVMFSIDRCIAVIFPFRYQEHLIYKKYISVLVCGWAFLLLSVILTYYDVLHKSFLHNLMTIALFCCVLSICFCYIMIYKEVRRKRQIVHVLPAINQNMGKPNSIEKENAEEPAERTKRITGAQLVIATTSNDVLKETKQQKITENDANSSNQRSRSYTVVAILSVFLLCYLPVTVVNVVSRNHVIRQQVLEIAYDWTNFLVLLNSSINPVIYCIRVHQIRSELKRLLKL